MNRISLTNERPTEGLLALYSYKIPVPGIGNVEGIITIDNLIDDSALGGWRCAPYKTSDERLLDGICLARDMDRKFGLANIPMGGAKSPTTIDKSSLTTEQNRALCFGFAEVITLLRDREGIRYITGKDMGRTDEDIALVAQAAPGLVAVGSPSGPTAEGVFRIIQAFVPSGSVAIEGLGDVGMALAKLLCDTGAYKVFGHDRRICQNERAKELGVIVTPNILEQDVDVFSGCAGSFGLHDGTIPLLKARYSFGSANIEMENPEWHSVMLQKKNIKFMPGFGTNVAGAGSLINPFISKPIVLEELFCRMTETALQVIDESIRTGRTAYHIAKERAVANTKDMKRYAKVVVAA